LKFFFDNNLSPHLAHAIGELCKAEEADHSCIHLKDRFKADCKDQEWMEPLATEGGWCVISQDRFNKNDVEREAVRRAGMVIFALARGWNDHKHWEKAQNLVRWWPAIMEQAARIRGGAMFRVPWKFSGAGRFEQIKI
jgi:hypothetical protein